MRVLAFITALLISAQAALAESVRVGVNLQLGHFNSCRQSRVKRNPIRHGRVGDPRGRRRHPGVEDGDVATAVCLCDVGVPISTP